MNYITEELKEEKDSVLEYYLERGCKVIYPNKNIKIQLKKENMTAQQVAILELDCGAGN